MTVSQQLNPRDLDLWGERVDAMGLRVEASPLWPLIQRLYDELAAKGICFRPPFFVANEWGCPDGQPIIGVPFYLVDERLYEIEEQHADDLEDEGRIMMGLRHEVGHTINYAYKLYTDPEWVAMFGSFHREYDDDYRPQPFCRRCVRHLPAWYAQKHPDEDFAETFAVWMTPGLDWRTKYAGWDALKKLEYVDRIMARVGQMDPLVRPEHCSPDPDELDFTVGEFYERRAEEDAAPVHELGAALDEDLKEIFCAEGLGIDASSLLHDRRKQIMRSVSHFSGARLYVVKSIIEAVVARLRTLGLRAVPGKELDAVIGATAMIQTLTTMFITSGHLIPGSESEPEPDSSPQAA